MNAKDIRAEAERRLQELEAEVAELRKLLGKNPPVPAVVPYPQPIYVPTIQPCVAPYIPHIGDWRPFGDWFVTTTKSSDHVRIGDISTTSGQLTISERQSALGDFSELLAGLKVGDVTCACGPGGLERHRTAFESMELATLVDGPVAINGVRLEATADRMNIGPGPAMSDATFKIYDACHYQ